MIDYKSFVNQTLMTPWICQPLGGWDEESSSWFGHDELSNIMLLYSISVDDIKLCRGPSGLHISLNRDLFARHFIPLPRYHFQKVYGGLYGPLDLPKIGQEWKKHQGTRGFVEILDTFFDAEKLCGYIYFKDSESVNSLRLQDFIEMYSLEYDNIQMPEVKKYA